MCKQGATYEAYSFYIIEDDGGGNALNPYEQLTLFGQKFGKQFLQPATNESSGSPTWLKASLEALDVVGKAVSTWCLEGDDKVGYAYLNYYDNPFRIYEVSSAEKGTWVTVQFSDNSNTNVFEYK